MENKRCDKSTLDRCDSQRLVYTTSQKGAWKKKQANLIISNTDEWIRGSRLRVGVRVEACKQTNKQIKPAFFFLFQDHHQLEVIAPSSFYPPSFYPSKLFVSFLIYIMSCSLLTTPFIIFPSTLSSPANIDITMTSCLYLIQ